MRELEAATEGMPVFRVTDPRQLDALFDALERGAAVFSSWE
ncbi:hypothetical protein [Arcanobacterium canis]